MRLINNNNTSVKGDTKNMKNLMPSNLSILCDILQVLISEIEDMNKKNGYLKVEKAILNLFELNSLNDVKDYYDTLNDEDQITWCLDAISNHNLFSIINRLSTIIDIDEEINFHSLIVDLNHTIERNKSKEKIKKSLCYLVLLNVISFSCNKKQILDRSIEEQNILKDNNLYFDSHKEIFLIILYCVDIFNTPKNTISIKLENFNKDLYYSSSIAYLNKLKDDVYKTSKETNEKVSKFYAKILEIIGLLIAIFSIIGVNCFTIASQSSIDPFNIVLVNASLSMSIAIILFLVHNIINEKKVKKFIIVFILALLTFFTTIILYFLKNNVIVLNFNW